MLVSECCNGRPYFALSEAHGVMVNNDNEYWGYCSECKDPAKFVEENYKKEKENVIK